jgi:hypothetical protein
VDGEPHRTSTLGRGVGASSHRLRKLACEQVTDTDCLSVMHARDNRVLRTSSTVCTSGYESSRLYRVVSGVFVSTFRLFESSEILQRA